MFIFSLLLLLLVKRKKHINRTKASNLQRTREHKDAIFEQKINTI